MADPCVERVNPLIDHLARVARGRAGTALEDVGLRLRHVVGLTLLRERGDATQQALGAALQLDPSNVVGLLNELEAEGRVVRRRHPDDRRRHVVAITDAGLGRLDAAEAALGQVEDDVLGRLEAGERAQLYALLSKALGGHVAACVEADAGADSVELVDALDQGGG